MTAIDRSTNEVAANIPNGQAAQTVVYVPEAVPTATSGTESLASWRCSLRRALATGRSGKPRTTSVSQFDQGLTQVLQAAVAGLDPAKP